MSTEIKNAVDTLKKAFKADPAFAHTWHCNIAMAVQDSDKWLRESLSIQHAVANDGASRFMKLAFDVETSG